MPKNIRGILTLNNLNSIYILIFTIVLYKSYTVATFKYLGLLLPINYIYIITFTPNSQRASFYNIIEFLPL